MCWRSHQAITNFSILQRRNNYKVTKIARNVANKIKTVCVSRSAKILRSLLLGLWSPQCKNIENPINSVCVFSEGNILVASYHLHPLCHQFLPKPLLWWFSEQIISPDLGRSNRKHLCVPSLISGPILCFLFYYAVWENKNKDNAQSTKQVSFFKDVIEIKCGIHMALFPPRAFRRVCVWFSHHSRAFSSVTCAPLAPWGLGHTHGLIWSF